MNQGSDDIAFQALNKKYNVDKLAGEEKGNDGALGVNKTGVFRQFLMVTLANLSIISTGMALGYPAVTLNQLQDSDEQITLSASQASWFASINAIACPFGGLLCSYLLDKVGRRRTFFVINSAAIISWGLMVLTLSSNKQIAFTQIMISRFIIGVTTGLASSPAGVYSAEICYVHLRGRLTLGTSISIALGILFIYILGFFIRNDWRLISGITCAYTLVAAILSVPIKESPSWLITKGRYEDAKLSLGYFRGMSSGEEKSDRLNDEFSELLQLHSITNREKKENIFTALKQPEVYKPLCIMVAFFAFQQFSGIFVVIVYAVQFSIEAGVSIDPVLCAILIGLTRTLTTFLVGCILDKWGRRLPAMFSGIGMAISMFLLAATIWSPFLDILYLPVTCIVIYIFTSTLGLMTLPFSMMTEVYPQKVRGFATGLTASFAYLMSFFSVKLYPTMVEMMKKENVFAFYGLISLLAVVFVYFFLPETKGKSLQDIEIYFKRVTTGLASSPAGVYSAEICYVHLRGRLTLGTSISIALGILFIYILGFFIRNDWRLISGITCAYTLVAAILSVPIKESPSWLITKGRYEDAKLSLGYFRGMSSGEEKSDRLNDEFSELLQLHSITNREKKENIFTALKQPEVYKPLCIMVAFFAFQQFSGIFVVIVYAVQFSIEAGVSIDPVLCAILIGLTCTLTTFLVGCILDKWGRRLPAMFSGIGMAISMFLLAATIWSPFLDILYLPVTCIVIYIFTSTLGLMTLPFSMMTEVYPQKVRGFATGLTACFAYLMSFFSVKLYPTMVEMMKKENVFAFYGPISLLAVVFVYFFLPENKGKSLQDIEIYFKSNKFKNVIKYEIEEVALK